MGLNLRFVNKSGTVEMSGTSDTALRIKKIDGMGLVEKEYNVATYSGYDGQETLKSRALPRIITIAVEFCCPNVADAVRRSLGVLGEDGYLFVKDEYIDRRIYCNQVKVTDGERVLRGQISSMVIQFVCDNPFFEDARETVIPIYQRIKRLETPFSLPTVFGEIVVGTNATVRGTRSVEPIISLYYPKALETVEQIFIQNDTTGAFVRLDYTPQNDDTVTIDIKNRKIHSSVSGNIINALSDDTFLGDFVLNKGVNVISVDVGDVTSGFFAECRFCNLYGEAVIV